VHRLREQRKPGRGGDEQLEIARRRDECPVRSGNAARAENLLGACLVEAEREREGIAARVGDAVELADRGDVGFAIGSAQTLGNIEYDVGAGIAEPEGEVVGRFESDDFTVAGERIVDGINRGR
jgi:hypothetical protein